MTVALADRVMRARRETLCPVCLQPMKVGQLIARYGTWQHVEHVIERQREGHGPLLSAVKAPGGRVALVDHNGDQVADLDPADAWLLARQLEDAAGTP
jgi:hypothetical protein